MANWNDNIEAVARAVCANTLADDGISEEQLSAGADMLRHRVAARFECQVIDESGEMYGYRDRMRRHSDGHAAITATCNEVRRSFIPVFDACPKT